MHRPSDLNGFIRRQALLPRLLSIALAVKISTILVILLAFYLLPYCEPCYRSNFIHPQGEEFGLASAFKTWDGHHYIYLAEEWYSPGRMSNAFYPLYPLAVRLVRPVFLGNTLLAGMFLSHAFFLAFLCFLYHLTRQCAGEETAYRAGLLFLAFPSSYYTSLVYTESLFLLLGGAFLWALRGQEKRLACGVAAFLLPLTRPQGILMAGPALWLLCTTMGRHRRKQAGLALLSLLLIAAGFGIYLLIMKISTGDYLAGFASQDAFVARNTLANLIHPVQWFKANFVEIRLAPHGFTNSMIDRVFFVFFLASLIPICRRLDGTLIVYSLAIGFMGALAGSFMAYTRYLLPVFPICMAMASVLRERYWLVLIPAASLQALFLVMHCLNYWAA